ncbi:MAG: molybdate transporter, inner rane subunit [Thermomicrobiales bacterium]|nr:molybdate transporter, inner rane subunit [Thermomicrobiales bacterium]MCD6057197.1 molybdate transporter, inner rane subunit [Thermomicrobiales bacterium]MDF3015294.1 molybdate transporter, inner rane subunit [Thermomicrobiales bacterium]
MAAFPAVQTQDWSARDPARHRYRRPSALGAIPGAVLVLFIVVPLLAVVGRAATAEAFWPSLSKPIVREALTLSAITTGITDLIAFLIGTPLAHLLARRRFPGKQLVETVIDVPLVLPPVVAGIALLLAFGRRGLLGHELELVGITLPFTTAAVVMAQVFVAVPFYVRSAKVGILAVPREVEEAAAVDGASPAKVFRDVTLPLALLGRRTNRVWLLGAGRSCLGERGPQAKRRSAGRGGVA